MQVPVITVFYHSIYKAFRNLIFQCKPAHGVLFWFVFFSYLFNLFVGYFFSASSSASSLVYRIPIIIFESTHKEVCWINARRIVAFMANEFSFWDWPIVKFIRDSMRAEVSSIYCYTTISVFIFMSSPQPTIFSFINFSKKQIHHFFFHRAQLSQSWGAV